MSRFGLGFPGPQGDKPDVNDAFVTWLMHFNEGNNSKYAIDHSAKQNGPVIVGGGGYQPNGTGYFGASSMWFAGDTYAYSPVNVENAFNLGAKDFTIDWWEYRSAEPTVYHPSFTWDTLGVTYVPMLVGWGNDAGMFFYASNDQASWNIANAMPMGAVAMTTWVHRAIVRKGNTFYAFENGVLKGTATSALAFNHCTYGPMLGCWPNPGGYNYLIGYIDEFRVSNGIARWTANFTPPKAPYTPDPDLNTMLLMHFGGAFNDSSQYMRGVATVTGSVQLLNGSGKFGRASAYFDRQSVAHLSYPDSAHWVLGTQDFTIDAWVSIGDYPAAGDNYGIVTQMNGAGDYNFRHLMLYINSTGALVSDAQSDAVTQIYFTGTAGGAVPLNTWTHVALVRNGTAIELYVNGVKGSGYVLAAGASFPDYTGPLRIGGMAEAGPSNQFKGYIDEVRFVRGKAMWTANFTPPTEPYPITPDKTVLLCHFNDDFKDTSPKRRGDAYTNNAVISTAQSKFGGRSVTFPATPCYVAFLDSGDFGFSVEDFTIDCWMYTTDDGATTQHALFGQCGVDLTNLSCGVLIHLGKMYCGFGKTGSDWAQNIIGVIPVTLNAWHHYAIVKQGSVIKQYLDGVLDGPPYNFGPEPMFDSSASFIIGALGNAAYFWQGHIDEFRITKGKALWTANFTPPTQPS